MPKGRIGLSLSEDVLAILAEQGRCDFDSSKNNDVACARCGEIWSHPNHGPGKPTRTELIERGVRLTAELANDVLAELDENGSELIEQAVRHWTAQERNGTTTRQVERSPERTQAGEAGAEQTLDEKIDRFIEVAGPAWRGVDTAAYMDDVRERDSSFNSPEVAKKKAQRKERKGKLAESVKEALPPTGVNSERIIEQQPGTYCPKHRPKYCEPDCPHRVSAIYGEKAPVV